MELSEPRSLHIAGDGRLRPATSTVVRRLSDMHGMYADKVAEAHLLEAGDPLIYEVFQWDVPPVIGELFVCTTILHPGRVGDEYFMTKGHFPQAKDAEVYYGVSGQGSVLMMKDDSVEAIPIGAKAIVYVPPLWAHRTANTRNSRWSSWPSIRATPATTTALSRQADSVGFLWIGMAYLP